MIDLHIHTNYSDGADTLEQVIEKANNLNLKFISITDHDTCKAYSKQNTHILQKFNGTVIKGVEISTFFSGHIVHILAYDYDVEKLAGFVKEKHRPRKEIQKIEIELVTKKLEELDIKFNKNNIDPALCSGSASAYILKELFRYKENLKYFEGVKIKGNQFFWNYLTNQKSPFFINFQFLYHGISEVISAVKKAGGKCILAHAYNYGLNLDKDLDTLRELGIDGIECYYPTYTKEQSNYLINYCNKHELIKSAGSDYHGEYRIANSLGACFNNSYITEKHIQPEALMKRKA